jgi:uncharacterized protein (DUF952 family)
MDVDLLFIPLNSVQWKECSSKGFIEPSKKEGSKSIRSIEAYTPSFVEEILNFKFVDQNELLLILIDPIRIQVPIKSELNNIKPNNEEDSFGNSKRYPVVHLQGKISIDAVIDRIPIKKNKDGLFHVHVETID